MTARVIPLYRDRSMTDRIRYTRLDFKIILADGFKLRCT